MSKSIRIAEGRITKRISPVNKIKINNLGQDDTSLWISKDQVKYGTLYASENGVYIASEDGYTAYNEVVVRVTDDSYYGEDYKDWEYTLPEYDPDIWDADAFSVDPDIWNSPDIWGDDSLLPDNGFVDTKFKDLGTDEYKPEPISGIDPETGNKMNVNVDDNGFLTEELLPSYIQIDKEPDRLEFFDGHRIVYSGMIVRAYTEDGNIWTNSTHPDGIIPIKELTLPIINADINQVIELYKTLNGYSCACASGISVINTGYADDHTFQELYIASAGEGPFYIFGGIWQGIVGGYVCSPNPFTILIEYYQDEKKKSSKSHSAHGFGTEGKYPVYYDGRLSYQGEFHGTTNAPINGMGDPDDARFLAQAACYGDLSEDSGKQEIPVQWVSPDGETFEDSFYITVKENPS